MYKQVRASCPKLSSSFRVRIWFSVPRLFLIHLMRIIFFDLLVPTVRCSWLGFRHPFGSPGPARLPSDIWITWGPDFLANLISAIAPAFEIQNRGAQANPRHKQEICIHEILPILKHILSYFQLSKERQLSHSPNAFVLFGDFGGIRIK
jgi:hypothetical protein